MTSPRTIVVEIPLLPPRQLSPNWRGHWRVRHQASRLMRQSAMMCALNASDCSRPGFEKARLIITIVVPDRRYIILDTDNTLACLKPAVDGCVDAGIIAGDTSAQLRYVTPVGYLIDKERAPLTILAFTEVKR